MARVRVLGLLAVCALLLCPPARAAMASGGLNPCRSATAGVVAGDKYLDVTYRITLGNPTDCSADVTLLSSTGILEKVDGVTGDLVVNRVGDALMAGVPAGWNGTLTIRTKVAIADTGTSGWRLAAILMPPAVSRSMEFDLPGRNVQLDLPSDRALVTPLGVQGDRSRFRVVPLSGDKFVARWAALPPPRPAAYTLRETHRISEDVPAFADDVELQFDFTGATPHVVRAGVPAGVTLSRVQATGGAGWKIADGVLEVGVADGYPLSRLTVQCHLEGAAQTDALGAATFAVPLFGSPDAERWQGEVYVAGGRHELAFAALQGARQTAASGDWRLACEFQGKDIRIAVRAVPIPVRRQATVETHYAVSEYRVLGTHSVTLAVEGAPATALTLLLPPGQTARAVTGDVGDWSQDGGSLHVELAPKKDAAPTIEVTTESLTGGRLKLELAPPTVEGATSSEYFMAVTHAPEVLLKTAAAEAPWRVTPQALPAWLGQLSPPIAYHYRDAAPAVALEALPVQAEVRGTVQDHVAVGAERVQRDTLFLIDIQKRALPSVDVLLPAGLTPDSVEGPYVAGWDVAAMPGGGTRVTVRFPTSLTGGLHFRILSSRPASAGPLSLRGIGLAEAPALHGWLGIGTDVSTSVRPVEDGHTNLASVRTDQAPAYLKGFSNRLVYEFYSTDWQLALTVEHVPAVYDAEVLNVLSFSASGVEATAFVNVKVAEGGVGELQLSVPSGAAAPQVDAPDVVMTRWSDGAVLVRFRGPRTGATTLRVGYVMPTGAATADLGIEPVRVAGARAQSGVLLLVQGGPEVDVKVQAPPRALQSVEAEGQYPDCSYRREHPALAAYAYRDAGWRLPVAVTTHPLSEQMLRAIIPVVRIQTLVQSGGETLNRLRLFVTNTNRQFLTVDLARIDPNARLIGTYVWSQPVKPFRQGTVLELPLFASEKSAQVGMSVIDIVYAAPAAGLGGLGRQRLGLPDLGLNVGNVEWTVRLPSDYRLASVGGNLDNPVSAPPPVRSLAARLLGPVADVVREHGTAMLWITLVVGIVALLLMAGVWVAQTFGRSSTITAVGGVLLGLLLVVIVASLVMPSLTRARYASAAGEEASNVHAIGLAIEMYRSKHGGVYPPNLRVLLDQGFLDDQGILQSPFDPDAKLVYEQPGSHPEPASVIAYLWHPKDREATVLYADDAVGRVYADSDGNLVNPRMKAPPIATARTLAVEAAPAKPFGGEGVSTEELAEALQMGQQMAQKAGASPASQPVDMRRLNEALIAANRSKIEKAVDAYAKEHGGQEPQSAEDLSGYLPDARLRMALRDVQMVPGLERARREALKSSEPNSLLQIGLAMAMYRNANDKQWPPDVQALLPAGYLGARELLTSPRGDASTRLVYLHPSADAKPNDVVAYFWSASFSGTNLLYADNAVVWAGLDAQGRLVSPRDGRVIMRVAGPTQMAQAQQQATEQAMLADKDQLARSRYSLGNAYMQRGDYDAAEKQFSDALQLDTKNEEARRGLEQLHALRSEIQEQAKQQAAKGAIVAGLPAQSKSMDELKSVEQRIQQQELSYHAAEQAGQFGYANRQGNMETPQRTSGFNWALGGAGGPQAPAPGAAPTAAVAEEEMPVMQPRLGKASLVQQVSGGRSIGALPITIDFPTPAGVSYDFVKPFLGRADATLSFRVLSTGSVMLLELALAVVALAGYGLVRRRAPQATVAPRAGAGYAAVVLAVSIAALWAAPVTYAPAFGAAALAMGVCLAAEVIRLTYLRIHATRTGS